MKQCPHCRMTVDASDECPICFTSLTYESSVPAAREKLVWNRYLLLHLLRHMWFSLLCTVAVLIRLLIVQPVLTQLYLYGAVLLILSLITALFERRFVKWSQWKYNERYAYFSVGLTKYFAAIIGVVFCFIA
ncbi:MAG: hypothetical protein E7662_04575 [Ruminococcaceae bacterium]|nr:hypothetical protein [Oscillospiraceae bacterium]